MINLLNKVRITEFDDDAKTSLKSRFISVDNHAFPSDAVHIWAEKKPVSVYNACMSNKLETSEVKIDLIDIIPKNVSASLVVQAQTRSPMEFGGLACTSTLKVGKKVMLTVNIDIENKLTNGQIGTLYHIKVGSAINEVMATYVKDKR